MDGPVLETTLLTTNMKMREKLVSKLSKKCKVKADRERPTQHWKHVSHNVGTIRNTQVQKRQYCSINYV